MHAYKREGCHDIVIIRDLRPTSLQCPQCTILLYRGQWKREDVLLYKEKS